MLLIVAGLSKRWHFKIYLFLPDIPDSENLEYYRTLCWKSKHYKNSFFQVSFIHSKRKRQPSDQFIYYLTFYLTINELNDEKILFVLGISEQEFLSLFSPYGNVITKNILKVRSQINQLIKIFENVE